MNQKNDYSNAIKYLLKKHGIKYWTSGNNVGDNFINVNCPYCTDASNHLGIAKSNLRLSCWRCDVRGNLHKLLNTLVDVPYSEYKEVINKKAIKVEDDTEKQTTSSIVNIKLPPSTVPIEEAKNNLLHDYLQKRNLSLKLCKKYNLGFCRYGEYALRIVIPVYLRGTLVAFQTRDTTGKAKEKYKTSPSLKSIPINQCLYNFNRTASKVYIAEGVFDVFSMGNDCVATFGASLSESQKNLLLDANIDEATIIWDRDAYLKALKIGKELCCLIPKVKVLKLPENQDPGDLGYEKIKEIEKNTNYL